MTTPLSSLTANATANKSVELTAAQTNPKQIQPLSNVALANATALANSARATIARLPEQILSITSQPTNSVSASSVPQSINVQVPTDVYQQTLQHARLSLLNNAELPKTNSPSGALALLSTASQAQSSVNISRSDVDSLIKAIEQAILKNTAAASIKATVSQRPDGQLALTTSQGNVLNLPEINSKSEQALRNLIGQRVTVSLVNSTGTATLLSIQPERTGSLPLQVPLNGKSAEGISFKPNALTNNLIQAALQQGTVAVDIKNAAMLNRFLPQNVGQGQNVLQSTALISLTQATADKNQLSNQLTLNIAQRKALVTFSSADLNSAIPSLSKSDTANLSLNAIPQGKVLPANNAVLANSLTDGLGTQEKANINEKGQDPRALKGTDVHQAISTLSRVLLSQTGSTREALSQLLSTVQGRESTALPTNALLKLTQQLTGVDALNAKPAGPLPQKAENASSAALDKTIPASQGENTPSKTEPSKSEHLKNQVSRPEINAAQNTIKNALQPDTSQQTDKSLASLAASIGAQAKTLSSNALTSVLQQFASSVAKQTTVTSASTVSAPASTKTDGQATAISDAKADVIKGENAQTTSKLSASQTTQDISQQSLPERIQQVLSTAALVTTPTTLTTPVNQSGFVQGLVTLLQLALAGRALQRQPSLKTLIDSSDSVIAKTLSNMGVSTTPSRVSQDVNQLDTRQQLLSQLKTLLASHQQTKVSNAEARIQGQEAFYYILPSLSQTQAPTELLIQREKERQNQQEQSQDKRKLWNVTMKLDIGDAGQVLAKSKIDQNTITLSLYASNDIILRRLADTLPYLTKRLSSLGLEVAEANYQRGQIPDTLNTRPHQIFETRV